MGTAPLRKRCVRGLLFAVGITAWFASAQAQRTPPPLGGLAKEPFQVFDDFVGTAEVASDVVSTSGGLILIDTLYGGQYTEYPVGHMRVLGLDVADVKYVLILQGHWDHYGGAKEIQDRHTDAAYDADDLFERAARLADRRPGDPYPWVASEEFQAWLDELVADSRERLERAR